LRQPFPADRAEERGFRQRGRVAREGAPGRGAADMSEEFGGDFFGAPRSE